MSEIENKVERQQEVEQIQKTAEELRNQKEDNKKLGDDLKNQEYSFDETENTENENPEGSLKNEKLLDDNPLSEDGENLKNQSFQPEHSEVKRELLTEEQETIIKDIVEPHYDKAKEIANRATKDGKPDGEINREGAYYTDHNKLHVEEVTKDTIETLDALVEAHKAGKLEKESKDGDIGFTDEVDYKVTQVAAMSHDTGMSNNGYVLVCEGKNPILDKNGNYIVEKQNPHIFQDVRANHTINSALNILKNRETYIEAGFTDTQVDEIAMLVYAHSKSNSGIENLNRSNSWKVGFERMQSFIEKYNEDNPDKQISFNGAAIENDPERMKALATEALALRVGDVSRDSGPDSVSQSGETVHVEKNETNLAEAKNWKEETMGFDVNIGGETLLVQHMSDDLSKEEKEKIDKENNGILKSKQVHIGEQNIVENHTEFKEGKLTHTITVNDGDYAPYCTAEAIKDHLGEFASAKNGDFVIEINFNESCNEKTIEKYEKWRDSIVKDYDGEQKHFKYENVIIVFPWD